MNFLILSTTDQKHLIEAIEELGHKYELHDPADFVLFLNDKPQGYDAIYLKGRPITRKRFNAVIPRIMKDREHAAALLKHLSENLGVFCLQSGASLIRASNKFRQAQILSAKKIRVPKQLLAKNIDPSDIEWIISKVGLPIVAKPSDSFGGNGVLILETELSASMTIEFLHKSNQGFILQEFIPTAKKQGAEDLRVIVCGGKVVNSMRRIAPTGQFRANLSIDATGEPVELTADQKRLAVEAAEALGFDFVGLDILSKTAPNEKHDYILEANATPGSKSISITGKNHFLDVVSHVATMIPTYKRTFDAVQPKRMTLPEGVEIRDIAYTFKNLEHWIAQNTQRKSESAFQNEVKRIEDRLGQNGKFIVGEALTLLENSPVKRSWDWRM